MSLVDKVLSVASNEIGTKESPANSNKQKYGEEYGYNGVPWCVIFLWWVFKHAGCSQLFYGGSKTASCSSYVKWAKSNNNWITSRYQKGDIIFFDFGGDGVVDHVGIVESASSSAVTTIEGNTSYSDQSNGGEVMRRSRGYDIIVGASRPRYGQSSGSSSPVNSGTKGSTEKQIYDYVTKTMKLNTAIACGILANAEYESGFDYNNNTGDGGNAYGLLQWNDRRESLFEFAGTRKPTLSQQLAFMNHELMTTESNAYATIKNLSNSAQGAYSAGYNFCFYYERPQYKDSQGKLRGNTAVSKYWSNYSGDMSSTDLVPSVGDSIVDIAKSLVGKSYKQNTSGPDTFDNSGFIYYCFNQGGSSIPEKESADSYFIYFSSQGATSIEESAICGGDLLFWQTSGTGNIEKVAIADGEGGCIYASESLGKVVYDKSLGNPTYVLRVLSETELSPGVGGYGGSEAISISSDDYLEISALDPYAIIMEKNLDLVEAANYDYGYLIDMDHGGVFKFYIPEFSEDAGANWEPVDIRGRSVQVMAYENTSSRKVTISLDLYAGAGLYATTEGREAGLESVERLHKDLYFLKSLEYPDYSDVVVRPPSMVHLIVGSAINFAGVVSAVSIQHLKPFDEQNRALYAKVSFTVTQVTTNPPDYKDIRNGNYTILSSRNRASMSDDEVESILPNTQDTSSDTSVSS